jgi:hypothetical protein
LKSYIPSQQYEIAKNGEKKGGFAHFLAYKSPKTPFFAIKILTRYTHETFIEVYTNFKAHNLSRCRDIPLQSFGSHIRPQLHGLGLTFNMGTPLFGFDYGLVRFRCCPCCFLAAQVPRSASCPLCPLKMPTHPSQGTENSAC